ncbi:MAG: hypothetical protein IKA06_07125 [Clostridia bacterium]|nr:hypothetical protein [Clostridia bacterium]
MLDTPTFAQVFYRQKHPELPATKGVLHSFHRVFHRLDLCLGGKTALFPFLEILRFWGTFLPTSLLIFPFSGIFLPTATKNHIFPFCGFPLFFRRTTLKALPRLVFCGLAALLLCAWRYMAAQKNAHRKPVISLSENLHFDKSASIAFDRSNALWAKPKPLLQAERARIKGEKSFYSCSDRFYE